MNPIVTEAKAEFLRAKNRIQKALETTPDDKINWSPSPSARTAVQQVAHVAMANTGIQGMLQGKPFEWDSIPEADAAWRKLEQEYTTREQVNGFLDKTSTEYLAFLDTLTDEQVASTVSIMGGTFPTAVAITFPADHTRGHAAQIDYIQTILGDLDWHF